MTWKKSTNFNQYIAGTTIGAGILALPYTTQGAGFVPSSTAIFGTYVFSVVTGLLLAEANINLMCELGQVHTCSSSCYQLWFNISECELMMNVSTEDLKSRLGNFQSCLNDENEALMVPRAACQSPQ